MAVKRPLVNYDGVIRELADGDTLIPVANLWGLEFPALQDGSFIDMNGALTYTARLTLGGSNRTFRLYNMREGVTYQIIVSQDALGNRTIDSYLCYADYFATQLPVVWVTIPRPVINTNPYSISIVRLLSVQGTVYADIVNGLRPEFARVMNPVAGFSSVTYVSSLASVSSSIALAGADPNGTIYRSTDGGLTWTSVYQASGQSNIRSLVSVGGGVVLAGTESGGQIHRSTNDGQTWSHIQRLGSENCVRSLCNVGSNVVLAGTNPTGQVYRSTNGGSSWSLVTRLGSETDVWALELVDNNIVLAGTAPTGHVYRSTNGGQTWTFIQRLGSAGWVKSFARIPNTNIVLAGTDIGQIYRSTDLGLSWSLVFSIGDPTTFIIWAMRYLPNGSLIAGTIAGGKIFVSYDAGMTWSFVNTVGNDTHIMDIAVLSSSSILFATGTNGRIYRTVPTFIR